MEIIRNIRDAVQGKLQGKRRSSKWPATRKAFLAVNPRCAICGGAVKLEVHHKVPFHLSPELELNPQNLIVLCESKKNGLNCHLFIGHLGNYKGYNPSVQTDAEHWHGRLRK